MERYTGPRKVNPPLVVCRSGPPFTDVCALQGRLERAQVVDTQWLNSLLHDPNPIEWGGYADALARVECSPKPTTTYMFGPLINAPPSHPDTVLTTLSYFEKTLTEPGMKTSNLSADMQLYIVATLIKWASHGNRFKSVILRPGGMHTLMSFNGCIGNLMKASGLEVLVGAAFGGLTSIMTGKAWVKSMRAFHMVTAALLCDFLKDGPETLLETGRKFICSLYGVAAGESMASARYALYTKRTRGKAVCVKTLPPTDANLAYHILRAHYQVKLWKTADQQIPPAVDIAAYGWEWCRVCANSTHCKRTSSSSCPHGRHQLPMQSCRESLQQSCM